MLDRLISFPVFRLLMALVFMVAIGACQNGDKKQKFAYVERPVEQLYSAASDRLERKRYPEAIQLYEEVERQHPFTAWARRATLMKSFAYYQQNEYEEAISGLDQFISLHPGNKDIPYAHYFCLLYTSPSPRDLSTSRMPSSA